MYVCMYACMHVYMYIYIYTYVYICATGGGGGAHPPPPPVAHPLPHVHAEAVEKYMDGIKTWLLRQVCRIH